MSTIYERLKQDHDKHRKMLELIASTSGDNEMRRDVWDKFYHDVSAHAAADGAEGPDGGVCCVAVEVGTISSTSSSQSYTDAAISRSESV